MSTPKLSPQQQQKALILITQHNLSQTTVAKRFGVHVSTINDLVLKHRNKE